MIKCGLLPKRDTVEGILSDNLSGFALASLDTGTATITYPANVKVSSLSIDHDKLTVSIILSNNVSVLLNGVKGISAEVSVKSPVIVLFGDSVKYRLTLA